MHLLLPHPLHLLLLYIMLQPHLNQYPPRIYLLHLQAHPLRNPRKNYMVLQKPPSLIMTQENARPPIP